MVLFPKDSSNSSSSSGSGSFSSFSAHLHEAKWRLGYFSLSFCLTFGLCFHFGDCFLYFFSQPLGWVHSLSSQGFIYTEITEVFRTYLFLSFYVSLFFLLPIFAYHLYDFVKPGLYVYEARALRLFLFCSFSLFFLANLWTYFWFLPMIFHFFLSFDQGIFSDVEFSGRILLFVHFVVDVCWQMGVCFQFPLYLFLLLSFGLLPRSAVARPLGRKIFFVSALTLAAFLTPPDVLSQIVVVSCIQVFFELSLFLVFFAEGWFSAKKIVF